MRKELVDEKRGRYIIGKRREKEAEHEKEESGNSVNIFGEIRLGAAILAYPCVPKIIINNTTNLFLPRDAMHLRY